MTKHYQLIAEFKATVVLEISGEQKKAFDNCRYIMLIMEIWLMNVVVGGGIAGILRALLM